MPPTIQNGGRQESRSRGTTGDKKSELVCRVKFNNTLPDIPFDPKFITYPFEPNRFVQYNPTSLERSYRYELLTEHDLGVNIDLINPDTYKIDPTEYLALEDERLLEEDLSTPQDSKRSRHHNRNVSWLRKTEYISTEYNRFTQLANKAESKVGFSIKKYFKEEELYRDRESQIKAIEDTFEAAKAPIEAHYSKPNVYPVDILPIFPDFEMWKHPCAQVIFDSDPASKLTGGVSQTEEMAQAMIRGMVDESGDQFVAYFLPTEETCGKRKRDTDQGVDYDADDEYEYDLAREYNWNVKNKASKGYEETYFFVFKEDGVYYNELETRVRLSKRRKAGGASAPAAKSKLIVKHRNLNEPELHAQEIRISMLEPHGEEEEEEIPMDLNPGLGSGVRSDDDEMKNEGSDVDVVHKNKVGSGSESDAGSGRSSRASSRSGASSGGSSAGSHRSSRSGSAASRVSSARSGSASSRSSSPGRSGSGSGSGSGSDSEGDGAVRRHKDEEEIFGSASSSDED